jgi:hypothetical protein
MRIPEKPMGALVRVSFLDGWLTYSTDQLEDMTPEQLAELGKLPASPDNPMVKAHSLGQTTNAEII